MGTTDNNFGITREPVDKQVLVLFLSTSLFLDKVAGRWQRASKRVAKPSKIA